MFLPITADKSVHCTERLNVGSELKSMRSTGNPFHTFTLRSAN